MRSLIPLAIGLASAGCSKPQPSDEDLEDFRPPTVQLRGDVVQRQQRRFERLDRNTDGLLSADEFPARGAGRIAALDGNRDGKVSRSEFVEGALARFDKLDANKDGQVTPDERAAAGNSTQP